MKRTLILLALFLAFPAIAQEASITAPLTPVVATKYTVERFSVDRDCLCARVSLDMRSSGEQVLRSGYEIVIESFSTPDPETGAVTRTATDLLAFLTAIGSARPSETGNASRRMNFRVLGYLVDSGRLPGVNLVP